MITVLMENIYGIRSDLKRVPVDLKKTFSGKNIFHGAYLVIPPFKKRTFGIRVAESAEKHRKL